MTTPPLLRTLVAVLVAALLWPLSLAAQAQGHQEATDTPASAEVPLFDDLGRHHYEISSDVPGVQEYFDQGLRLYYAFNHQEAVRSFREAQRRDPDCAICWWGEALAWGPNINLPMDSAGAVAARSAIEEALARRDLASPRERDLIDALATRYAEDPPGDRAALDSAWAGATGRLAEKYPDDDEMAVLHAEALMDLRPWDYWTEDDELQPGMPEALAGLRRVMERSPDHPGACHFFIHAVEKVHPEWAVPCAERLAGLMPGAGHIVHMPGHIYIRVGRYEDAIEANRHAVHADETYIQDARPGMGVYTAGYYPHNYDFMAFAALMVGRGDLAVEAAEQVGSLVPEELFGAPGMTFLEHFQTRPLQVRVRFGHWEKILATPIPSADRPHARAMWRYAQGRALAATGQPDAAREELDMLRTAIRDLEGVPLEFNESAAILEIAADVLAGRIAEADGRLDDAVASLRDAVEHEDALLYGEPPEWTVPVRQELGEVLLEAGRPAEAERAFREDLERFPDNGWSLRGLARALEVRDRAEEAAEVRRRFREVGGG